MPACAYAKNQGDTQKKKLNNDVFILFDQIHQKQIHCFYVKNIANIR